ncbi:disulfide bond formation protein DsbA [Nonomuraea longispora]|uniref:2-hydroxychromene-2-carboxylate isomerase n=1 Tax=Nonomuraea longispora TaxID=1848320 RepID=A0A4R4MJL9_9ACTN|nr:DsbA family protein [Nonomuraea longispora]TDB96030.1 disulfide bond formation protein DsbA [Nonomuraea longispora]
MTGGGKRARLYFSFRSPYSWLAGRRLLAELPTAFEEIDWIPSWEADEVTGRSLDERGVRPVYTPMSRAKHLYLLMDVKRLAAGEGVEVAWPIDVDPWWEPAHLGFLLARRHGREREFYDEITRARWERGENISLPEVVSRAGAAAGLDEREVEGAVDDPGIRAEAVQCLVSAFREDVFGVPYVRWRRQRYWGVDRIGTFLRDLRRGDDRPVAESSAHVTPYDTDTGGGCG